jgi:hypothetical protein
MGWLIFYFVLALINFVCAVHSVFTGNWTYTVVNGLTFVLCIVMLAAQMLRLESIANKNEILSKIDSLKEGKP